MFALPVANWPGICPRTMVVHPLWDITLKRKMLNAMLGWPVEKLPAKWWQSWNRLNLTSPVSFHTLFTCSGIEFDKFETAVQTAFFERNIQLQLYKIAWLRNLNIHYEIFISLNNSNLPPCTSLISLASLFLESSMMLSSVPKARRILDFFSKGGKFESFKMRIFHPGCSSFLV